MYCGDKFTTVICYPESFKPWDPLHGVLPDSIADNSSVKGHNVKYDSDIKDDDQIKKEDKKLIKMGGEDFGTQTYKALLSVYTETGYHTHTDKLLSQNNSNDATDDERERECKEGRNESAHNDVTKISEHSREHSSIFSDEDIGNLLLSLLARVSELQAVSLDPSARSTSSVCDIGSYVRADDILYSTNCGKDALLSSLPYGVECTQTTFSCLLTLMELNFSHFCDDIGAAIEDGIAVGNGNESGMDHYEKNESKIDCKSDLDVGVGGGELATAKGQMDIDG